MLSPLNAEVGMKGIASGLKPTVLSNADDISLDLVVPLLVVVHGVHLVDGDDELVDAQGPGQEHVLLGLLHDAIRRCDDEDCCICLRCAGDHVLDEVSVTRTVHDGEVEFVGVEPSVSDIDGYASLTFFLERVHDPCELEGCLTLGFCLLPVLLDDMRRYGAGLEQQPADKGGLAVVDMSDNS